MIESSVCKKCETIFGVAVQLQCSAWIKGRFDCQTQLLETPVVQARFICLLPPSILTLTHLSIYDRPALWWLGNRLKDNLDLNVPLSKRKLFTYIL